MPRKSRAVAEISLTVRMKTNVIRNGTFIALAPDANSFSEVPISSTNEESINVEYLIPCKIPVSIPVAETDKLNESNLKS